MVSIIVCVKNSQITNLKNRQSSHCMDVMSCKSLAIRKIDSNRNKLVYIFIMPAPEGISRKLTEIGYNDIITYYVLVQTTVVIV